MLLKDIIARDKRIATFVGIMAGIAIMVALFGPDRVAAWVEWAGQQIAGGASE